MAKMGQPMLPMQGAVVAQDSTDSEADVSQRVLWYEMELYA